MLPDVEDVKAGVEHEGELELGVCVRREKGNVERIVLLIVSWQFVVSLQRAVLRSWELRDIHACQ